MVARLLSCLVVTVLLVTGARADEYDLGDQAPERGPKVPINATQTRARLLQGGDTIADAFTIPSVPFTDSGTTVGYANDYDVVCPFSGSTAPDVVYAFTPATRIVIDIDMCGSGYDTKISLLDAEGETLACNDDYYFDPPCGTYVSKLEQVPLPGGRTVYLVIDGDGDSAGDYELAIAEHEECYVAYFWDAQDEGEPPLHDEYVDEYNGGCDYESNGEFYYLHENWDARRIYGRTGWYLYDGAQRRDTDWFVGFCGYSEPIEIEIEVEHPAYFSLLGDFDDCDLVYVIESTTLVPCQPAFLTPPVGQHQFFAFWIGPTDFAAPDGFIGYEFNYVLVVNGLSSVTETVTWGAVKSLFR